MEWYSQQLFEAVNAHNDAQSKIVELLGQVRGLRTNIDDVAAERDQLIKDKKQCMLPLQSVNPLSTPTRDYAILVRVLIDVVIIAPG